jgi:hypothetical protein
VASELGLALQKRLEDLRLKARHAAPDRDRLSTEQHGRMTDAAAAIHRGAPLIGRADG